MNLLPEMRGYADRPSSIVATQPFDMLQGAKPMERLRQNVGAQRASQGARWD